MATSLNVSYPTDALRRWFVYVQASRLGHVTSTLAGVAKCPYSPRHNATYFMTSDGNFYTATVTDFTARDAAVYRMMGDAKYLRTAQYNSRWLNGRRGCVRSAGTGLPTILL